MNSRCGLTCTKDGRNWWGALSIGIVEGILIFGNFFIDSTMKAVVLHHIFSGSFAKNVSWVYERTVLLCMPWIRVTIITKFTTIDGLDGIGGWGRKETTTIFSGVNSLRNILWMSWGNWNGTVKTVTISDMGINRGSKRDWGNCSSQGSYFGDFQIS